MKTSARFLAMLLAVVMIASAALSVSAFSDVTGAVEHSTAINVLAQLGVIGGYEDGTFKPEQNVTRAEMAKLVYVLYTTFVDAGKGTVKFNDVKADNWAVGYISWCASKGIIGGYGDGNFGPNDNVTYDQALKMVAGTLGYNDWDSAQWPTDVRMKALNELKLGEDIPATVKGDSKLTRAQVAQIMYNALDADMNETKNESVELVPGSGIMVNMPKAKQLALDVWKCTEVVYTVIGTETYGEKTKDEEKITLKWTSKDENGKDKTNTETYELEELGLAAYAGNTDDLINLQLIGIEKDGERLGNVAVNGVVKDGVSVSYKSSRKAVTIDGKEYKAEDFTDEVKHPIALYEINGTESTLEVFENDELVKDFTDMILPNKQYLARTIDFEGDGYIDAFVIVSKDAYKVTDISTTKGVKYARLETLDEADYVKVPVADINIEVAEGDIVVAAVMGQKVYATKVEATTTYATRLSTSAGKVTLNNVGEVKFTKQTVGGVGTITISTADLGADNTDTYYIYEGEVLLKEKVSTVSDYTFAILRDVEESESKLDEVSMEYKVGYTANVLVIEDGKIVTKKLPLSSTVGEELFETYEAGVETVEFDDGSTKKVVKYNYALISSYEEDKDGYYDLVISKAIDAEDEDYIIVDAGASFKYNSKTRLFTVGTVNKVNLSDDSVVFYKDQLKTSAAKGFTDMKFYTKASLTTKDFEVLTTDIAVIAVSESGKRTLLATVVEKKIEGKTGDVASYENDGRLILYAPEGSSVELVDGKNYNSYIFMDNKTIANKEAEIDKNKEWDKTSNPGTVAGYLYGYNPTTEVYDVITKNSDLDTIKAATLTDVLIDSENIEYTIAGSADLINVSADVTIWGLADDEDNGVYTTFTLAELADMFELVKDYNENNAEDAVDFTIDILMTYYTDSNDELVLSSIIVEIYEADEEDDEIIYSVNDLIFDCYNK